MVSSSGAGMTLAFSLLDGDARFGRRRGEEGSGMPRETIEGRVDNLEHRVTELERLPDRISAVESQIVLLRTEMRSEFSAVRTKIAEKHDEALRYMRVLHEEVIGRLRTMQEGQQARHPHNDS
jgi:hypothetical protein